ncbi:MAG: DUF4388 domain-containing protein [Thermoanaerobaculia bacterium]
MERKRPLLSDEDDPRLRVVKSFGDAKGGAGAPYRVVADTPALLILEKIPSVNGTPTTGRVLMAGEILSHTTILDVVNVISASRWAGHLHVYGFDSHRLLTFDQGTLQHASSNHPEDRLNRLLVRLGILTASQVEEAMRILRPPKRLGRLLVEEGLITNQELFDLLNKQMEEIFFAALLETEGSYLFAVGDGNQIRPNTLAHISIQELLLRGAERLDSVKEWQRLVPDLDLCPELQPGVEATELDPKLRQVLALSNGERSLREIAGETWLGKYETLKVTRELVRLGCVHLITRRRDASEDVTRLVASFNEVLQLIFAVVEQRGNVDQTREEIDQWLEQGEGLQFLAAGLKKDGSVELTPRYAELSEVGGAYLFSEIRSALFQVTSFALFAASMSIPTEVERDLARSVYQRLHAMEL